MEELRVLNEQLVAAECRQTIDGLPWEEFLDRVLADDFVLRRSAADRPDEDKATFLQNVRSEEKPLQRSLVGNAAIWEADTVGVVTCTIRVPGRDSDFRNVRVFTRATPGSSAWACVYWQVTATPRGEPPPAKVTVHLLGFPVSLTRALKVSPDPVFPPDHIAVPGESALLDLYREICASWRSLADTRFKLVGLVPSVSAALLAALLLRRPEDTSNPVAGLIITVLGLLVTIGVALYDQRNSQLHDELISRGRRIEHELGVRVGQFLGRPRAQGLIKHDVALMAIYGVTIVCWATALITILLRF
ncbi:hypothetical protein [Nonomuraea soli]|uniref:Uncharacterized protein n=1 Tax=Nonomuraea soli TaxID=1032476 RepID=A0A7W0CV44_9ACTN|nr:hypothetical protein [Nonomuraea soli]MBA2897777.1 hypothetical protein [Nonomuraea soli]